MVTTRTPIAVDVARWDGAGRWRSIDFSEGGCFVSGGPLLDRNERVRVGFTIGAKDVVVQARVAWINPEGERSRRLPAGMGLQFIELDADARGAVRCHL